MANMQDDHPHSTAKAIFSSIAAFLAAIAALIAILEFLGIAHPPALSQTAEGVVTSTNPLSPTPSIGQKLLYSADWSNGLNSWTEDSSANSSWNINNGNLVNDGSSCCAIISPFRPSTTNYAVEAKIQMLSCSNSGGSFGLFGEGSPATDSNGGYTGYAVYWGTSENIKIVLAIDRTLNGAGWQLLAQTPFQIDRVFHTFYAEFNEHHITVYIDGSLITATTNTKRTGVNIGIEDLGCQINIASFSIYAL
jgi:hypothetical protein